MTRSAFSVIEVVLATALFAIFVTGAAVALISGLNLNQSAAEQTVANQYATEGLEAVRSIRNQNFATLANGTYGLATDSGVWMFSGSQNVFDKYTRTISIADVMRDGNGNIASASGTPDANTKKVTVNVAWQTGVRNLSTALTTYLTNWSGDDISGPPGVTGDGIVIYSDGTTTPKWRSFDVPSGVFSSENSATAGASPRSFGLRTSPTQQEAVLGYTDSGGTLRVLCYNGTSWSEDWNVNVGGTGTTRRFDMGYETSSGQVVVLYSNNTGTDELAYRTKPSSAPCGTGWTAATTFDSPGTTGVVQWVKMASDQRASSNLVTAIWADANSDLQAAVWSGSGWTQRTDALENSLEVVAAAQDIDDFDVEYESISGDVMVVWANSAGKNGTNGVRYVTCPGGSASCSWSAVTIAPTFSDDATNLDLSANLHADEMIFASIGNSGSDLQIGYWSGSAWTDTANVDTSTATPMAGTKLVATGWLLKGATSRSIVVYNDSASTNVGWYVCDLAVCTAQADFVPAAFGDPQKWYDIQIDPTNPVNKEQLVLAVTDASNDLWAKKLVMTSAPVFTWTNADNNVALGQSLDQPIASPFGFGYWRSQ